MFENIITVQITTKHKNSKLNARNWIDKIEIKEWLESTLTGRDYILPLQSGKQLVIFTNKESLNLFNIVFGTKYNLEVKIYE